MERRKERAAPGQSYLIAGIAEIVGSGEIAEAVEAKFVGPLTRRC
jgi:hypothetical protein